MNRIIKATGLLLLMVSTGFAGERVEESKTWTETFPVNGKPTFHPRSNLAFRQINRSKICLRQLRMMSLSDKLGD